MAKQEICLNQCEFNQEESISAIERLLDSATIFPDELMTEGDSSLKGIPLRK